MLPRKLSDQTKGTSLRDMLPRHFKAYYYSISLWTFEDNLSRIAVLYSEDPLYIKTCTRYYYSYIIITELTTCINFVILQAFGTMGILFPLVIPTVCSISNCSRGAVMQSAAAILASSLFGNGRSL